MLKKMLIVFIPVLFGMSCAVESSDSINFEKEKPDVSFPKEGEIEWERRMPNVIPRKGELVRKKFKVAKYGNTMLVFPQECYLHVEIDYKPNNPSAINGLDLKCPK